jgi:hypothetical protein
MFDKLKLKRGIKHKHKKILVLEQKRSRSQAALVTAILRNTTPSDDDVDFFNRYTSQIEEIRVEIHELQVKLEKLKSK